MDELRARILALTKAGVFGSTGLWPYVRDNNGEHQLGLQFASEIEFFKIGLDKRDTQQPEECEYVEIFVAVKTQLKGERERRFTNNDAMFFNEVYMYKTMLPLIEADELNLFPKCFYAEAFFGNNPSRDVVVIEDMKPQGYFTMGGTTLDHNHVKVALKSLGEFHGLSYKAKKHTPNQFAKARELKPIKFDDDFDLLLRSSLQRGLNHLENDENHSEIFHKLSERLTDVRQVLRKLKSPEEPFAVICHGEFHKGNILFSYEDGKPNNALFIDWQMSLYSDPSTDLSFLLFMNTDAETREKHWDEFLEVYWAGVLSVEPQPGFTFDEFLNNFVKKSIYGYLPASIFLPILFDEMEASDSIEEFLSLTLDDRIGLMEKIGGEPATRALRSIIEDLLTRGCVAKFLEYF